MSTVEIGALRAMLSASAGTFEDDMRQARDAVVKNGDDMRNAFERLEDAGSKLTSRFFNLKSIIGLVAGTGGLYYAVKQATDFADSIDKTSKAVGLSTDQLQEYQYAASQAGIAQDDFNGYLEHFNKIVGDAQRSSQTKELFKDLGIQIKDANGQLKPMSELLDEVANKFQATNNETVKASVSQELFRDRTGKMAQFLSQGSTALDVYRKRAHELGIVLSEDLVKKGAETNDQLMQMQSIVKSGLTKAVLELNPAIQSFGKLISDPATLAGIEALSKLVAKLIDLFVQLEPIILGVAAAYITWATTSKVLPKNIAFLATLLSGAGVTGFLQYKKSIAASNIPLIEVPNIHGKAAAGVKGFGDTMDETTKKVNLLTKELNTQNAASLNILRTYATFKQGAEQLNDKILAQKEALSQNIDLTTKAGQAWYQAFLQHQALDREMADGKKVLDDIRTPQQNYNDQVTLLNKLLKDGVLTQTTYQLALEKAKDTYHEQEANLKGIAGAGAEMGDALSQAFSDIINQSTSATASIKALGLQLINIIAKRALLTPLSNAVGDLFDAGLKSFGISGARAGGGNVSSGGTYLVGEKGPELFTPGMSGSIVSNSDLNSGSGGTVYNDFRGVDPASVNRLESLIKQLAGPGVTEKRVKDAGRRGKS